MDRFETTEGGAFLLDGRICAEVEHHVSGPQRVLLGRITGVHGLKGEIVVRSFTDHPEDIAAYGPLTDREGGNELLLAIVRSTEKGVVARIDGIDDRTKAEALKGTELWLERDRLPAAEDGEYYHADLIGLDAVTPSGALVGTVVGVQNFGASDLLEIKPTGSKRTELVAFTDAFVPEVDVARRRVVVVMPTDDEDQQADDPGDDQTA